jgi:hypothetical protein
MLDLLRTVLSCKKCKVHDPNMNACEKFKSIVNGHTTFLAIDVLLRHLNSQNNDPVHKHITHFGL